MTSLGALAFLSPWWLAALAALPILYWLLRITPPAPRLQRFPAIRLLFELRPKEETPAQTPLWLLLLRLLIATLLILALAHPLLNPEGRFQNSGAVVLVVDDGWAAARNWSARKTAMATILDRAERAQQPVVMLTTAASLAGESPRPSRLMRASDARGLVATIEPKPWPVDRVAVLSALDAFDPRGPANVIYLADGLDDGHLARLLERLQRIGPVDLVVDVPDALARLLLPPTTEAAALVATAVRFSTGAPAQAVMRALADDGRLLAREPLRWGVGERNASARVELPVELRNRLARLEIEGEASAGAIVLLDERWRRRPVGLVSTGSLEKRQPLLADVYYLERALAPYADIRQGTVAEVIGRGVAVLILADIGTLAEEERALVEPWLKKGGVLVRFAGPRTAEATDDLVPTPLRADGGRNFGGAMSWEQPIALAPFDANGAFAGLVAPDDVRISRQVLAEPNLELAQRTWARLADGTPLVTADKRGDGWVVMIHTTAGPDWSSLSISGLFVDMLRRLIGLSQGIAGDPSDAVLPPLALLDGFGRPQSPPPAAVAIVGTNFAATAVGPRHPPGFYGTDSARRALNLSAALQGPQAPLPKGMVDPPQGIVVGHYAGADEVDFKPWLLAAALTLGIFDLLIALALRGLLPGPASRRGGSIAAGLVVAALTATLPHPALTQRATAPVAPASTQVDEEFARAGSLATRFGYVKTGIADIDEVSRAGLAGLSQVMARRTTVEPSSPIELDIERDELAFFPLIYWPIVTEAPRLSPASGARVAQYLRQGGMILFDTRDAPTAAAGGLTAEQTRLREILRHLSLPALVQVPPGHVLTKSFYLLSQFPGRFADSPVWVEQGDDRVNDGVSGVIIGANDWASAWASDANGRSLYAAVPGGEAQRETAFRFGVNLVMYALAGNYKADQVHVEAILERLRR